MLGQQSKTHSLFVSFNFSSQLKPWVTLSLPWATRPLLGPNLWKIPASTKVCCLFYAFVRQNRRNAVNALALCSGPVLRFLNMLIIYIVFVFGCLAVFSEGYHNSHHRMHKQHSQKCHLQRLVFHACFLFFAFGLSPMRWTSSSPGLTCAGNSFTEAEKDQLRIRGLVPCRDPESMVQRCCHVSPQQT